MARRLLENGVSFIQVTHSNCDTHSENFIFHIEQLGEFDQSFATFIADLADRGLLEKTLVVVLSEFGRTPNINLYYGRDHWSKAWSVRGKTPSILRKIDAHVGWIRGVAISLENSILASVGNDRIVRLWSMETGEKRGEVAGHDRHIYSVLFHPNGTQLVTGDLNGKIHIWNVSDRKLERSIDATALYTENKGQGAEYGGVRAMAANVERNELIAGGTHKATNPFGTVHDPLMLRLNWIDGVLKKSHACEGITRGMVWRVQWLQDGTAVGVSGGSTGGILLFFNDTQEKEIHRFKLPSLARDMDIHLASNLVATAHFDNHLRISGMFPKT